MVPAPGAATVVIGMRDYRNAITNTPARSARSSPVRATSLAGLRLGCGGEP